MVDEETDTEHGGGGQETRENALTSLAADIAAGKRVLYGMCEPEMIKGIASLPAPFTVYLDDGTDELMVVHGGCGCPVSMLSIFYMVGLMGVVMITLPIETSLDEFSKESGYVVDGELQPTHLYVDFGMRRPNGVVSFPRMLKTAIGRVNPEMEADLDMAQVCVDTQSRDLLGLLWGLAERED